MIWQAALIIVAACILCIQIPKLGWSRHVTVNQTASGDLPVELDINADYEVMSRLQLKADTAMASADNILTVELYDEQDRLVFTKLIPLQELSVYEWTTVAENLNLTQKDHYKLKLYTQQDSDILPQAYLYGINCKYTVAFTPKDYVPYQLLAAFLGVLLIAALYHNAEEPNQENLQIEYHSVSS